MNSNNTDKYQIKKFSDSAYSMTRFPVIDTNKDDNGEDIIIFWYAMTSNYKVSKHSTIMRISHKDYPDGISSEELKKKIKTHKMPLLRALSSGDYIWSKPLLYSGKVV